MKLNSHHLRTKQKLTLYVPKEFVPYVEQAAELAENEGKSLGVFLWETLAKRLEEDLPPRKQLRGALAHYARGDIALNQVREQVKERVAEDAAREGAAY